MLNASLLGNPKNKSTISTRAKAKKDPALLDQIADAFKWKSTRSGPSTIEKLKDTPNPESISLSGSLSGGSTPILVDSADTDCFSLNGSTISSLSPSPVPDLDEMAGSSPSMSPPLDVFDELNIFWEGHAAEILPPSFSPEINEISQNDFQEVFGDFGQQEQSSSSVVDIPLPPFVPTLLLEVAHHQPIAEDTIVSQSLESQAYDFLAELEMFTGIAFASDPHFGQNIPGMSELDIDVNQFFSQNSSDTALIFSEHGSLGKNDESKKKTDQSIETTSKAEKPLPPTLTTVEEKSTVIIQEKAPLSPVIAAAEEERIVIRRVNPSRRCKRK